jgi:hypothetical protein
MKRSFAPPARETLRVLAGALVCGLACTPNQSVKSGAPELTEFVIVQAGPMATTIRPDTPECGSGVDTGSACLPMGMPADVADGGTNDADIPADTLCRQTAASNWCQCQPQPYATWNCAPFASVMAVIAVFDRLLDTAPLDPGDAAGLTDLMMTSAGVGPAVDLVTDYSSTGQADGLVFNLYSPFFGNFRADGPSLFAAPQPAFPAGTTVTVMLNPDKVRAKDGKTSFTGSGPLMGGTLVFTTAPFTALFTPPATPTDDNPTPPIDAFVTFTNLVDPAVAATWITATSNGAPLDVTVVNASGTSFSVTPTSGAWVSGATIVVNVSATAKDLLDEPIGAVMPGMFTAL